MIIKKKQTPVSGKSSRRRRTYRSKVFGTASAKYYKFNTGRISDKVEFVGNAMHVNVADIEIDDIPPSSFDLREYRKIANVMRQADDALAESSKAMKEAKAALKAMKDAIAKPA